MKITVPSKKKTPTSVKNNIPTNKTKSASTKQAYNRSCHPLTKEITITIIKIIQYFLKTLHQNKETINT